MRFSKNGLHIDPRTGRYPGSPNRKEKPENGDSGKSSFITIGVFLLVGLVLFWFGAAKVRTCWLLVHNSTRTKAKVVSTRRQAIPFKILGARRYTTIEFLDADQNSVRAEVRGEYGDAGQIGKQVLARYLPADPKRAEIVSYLPDLGFLRPSPYELKDGLIIAGLGICFLLPVLAILYNVLAKKKTARRGKRLLRQFLNRF